MNKLIDIEKSIFGKNQNKFVEQKDKTQYFKNELKTEVPLFLNQIKMNSKDLRKANEQFRDNKIDNTGNVRIWPNEEILAFQCLNNANIFKNKNILEIGGGISCLSLLSIQTVLNDLDLATNDQYFIATDGNPNCVNFLTSNLECFQRKRIKPCKGNQIIDKQLFGDNLSIDVIKIDQIIASDIFQQVELHESIINTLKVLKPNIFLFIGCERGDTLTKFINLLKDSINGQILIEKDIDPSNLIDNKSIEFDKQKHFPKLQEFQIDKSFNLINI